MQKFRERKIERIIDGREFYRMELEDGFETHYLISKDGWIYNESYSSLGNGRLRDPSMTKNNKSGYKRIEISPAKNERVSIFMHRLLAINFIKNELRLKLVDHKDRNPSNNDLSNLRWIDFVGNQNNRSLKGMNSCPYDFIWWQDYNGRQNGHYVFRKKINGKYKNIHTHKTIKGILALRNRWMENNGMGACLDINAT